MDLFCKHCKSDEFISEGSERVCTNCGGVQEDFPGGGVDLCMVPDGETMIDNARSKKYEVHDRLTDRIRGETSGADAKRRISREKLLVEMRRIVKQLVKHPGVVDETMDLVSATLKAHQGRLLSSKKLGLVGACIYHLSAKHQLGISLTDICKVIGIKMKVMSVCLKQVRDLCPNFEYERPNIKYLVKKFVDLMASRHYNLSALSFKSPNKRESEMQPLIDSKDKSVLQARVMLLIELFESMHPFNQPTPQSLITAVIYHAWRSLDTFKLIALNLRSELQTIEPPEAPSSPPSSPSLPALPSSSRSVTNEQQRKVITVKHSISFEKFCQLCSFKYSSNGHKIVSKLQASLLMLGRHLGDVNKLNLPWFLKDIIENSPHLIQEHMRAEPASSATTDSGATTTTTKDAPASC